MKVLVACFTDLLTGGGGATHAYNIAKGLKSRNYDVKLLSKVSSAETERVDMIDGIKVYFHKASPGIFWRIPLLAIESAIRKALEKIIPEPNCLIALSPYYVNAAKKVWPKANIIFKVPCLLSECMNFVSGGWGKNKLLININKKLMRQSELKALRGADQVMVSSEIVAKQIRDFLNDSNFKITIAHQGVADLRQEITKSSQEIRDEFSTPQESCVFLAVGSLDSNKNTFKLLKSFAETRTNKAYLWIAGNGPLRNKIEEFVTQMNLDNCVKILGYRSDMQNIYNASDVFLHAAHYEAFGNAYLEAMVSGLPVVGPSNDSDKITSSLPDMIEHNRQGFLYQYDNQPELSSFLSFFIKNSEKRKLMGKLARERALERFRWDKYIDVIETKLR